MHKLLGVLLGLGLLLAGESALADSTVPALPAATSLTTSTTYLAQGAATDTSLGFTTSVFDIAAGALTLKTNGVTNAMLANQATTVNGTNCTLGSTCTVTAAAGTLSGSTLAAGVTASSLTSVGTLGGLTMGGTLALGTNSVTGNFTVTGIPILSGILTGTIASGGNLGLDVSGNLVKATVSGGGGLTVGTTTIASGTTTKVLFDNAGVLGEYTISGTGNVAMTTSPTFTTPALGTPSSGNGSNLTALTAANISAGALANGMTATTQTVGDNTTKLATTAFVIANAGSASNSYTVANEGVTGTTVNKLAKLTGASPSTGVITATTDPPNAVAIGIVTAGAGTTSNATITFNGAVSCVFDGATTAGHAVGMSATTAGDCSDLGATPTQNQIIGTVTSTNVAGGTYTVLLNIPTSSALADPTATGQFLESTAAHLASFTSQPTFGSVLGSENVQSGTTYTLASTDCGKTVSFSNGSAVTVTIAASIVPASGTTCNISIRQDGAGQVSVNGSAVSAATLVSAHSYTKTFGQHAIIGLELTTISSTTTAVLTGDGA